jgi:hypothetical protein
MNCVIPRKKEGLGRKRERERCERGDGGADVVSSSKSAAPMSGYSAKVGMEVGKDDAGGKLATPECVGDGGRSEHGDERDENESEEDIRVGVLGFDTMLSALSWRAP